MRIRTIKKYGNTHAIKLETADIKDYDLSVGDDIDIEKSLGDKTKK